MYECLNGLAPAAFFQWFGRIAAIPHGSRKEQALAAFLKDFAKERNIPCQEDATGNLLMQLPAAPGYEDQPAILFQAHMDMIWEKAPGSDFDFETSPLNLKVEGDRLMADGTTLGADNAVGAEDELGADSEGLVEGLAVGGIVKGQLDDTRSVAEVDEDEGAQVSLLLGPAHDADGLADVGGGELGTQARALVVGG